MQANCDVAHGRRCSTNTTLITARNSCTAGICAHTLLYCGRVAAKARIGFSLGELHSRDGSVRAVAAGLQLPALLRLPNTLPADVSLSQPR